MLTRNLTALIREFEGWGRTGRSVTTEEARRFRDGLCDCAEMAAMMESDLEGFDMARPEAPPEPRDLPEGVVDLTQRRKTR